MMIHIGLVALALAAAAPCAAQGDTTTAEEQAQFDLLKKRRMERLGISPAAAGLVATPAVGAPAVPATGAPPRDFAAEERERATEFNKQFGEGTYEGITGFSDRCKYADGCNKLATADLIKGAYQFVALQRDVEKKVLPPDSDAYRSRHTEIKGGLRTTMEQFRPQPGGRTAYERDFIKFSDPIVKKIFSPAELLRYAERNASASDSAPFYTYLGQALNGAGPPARARAAFDAALQRDPKSDAALSGRAEARLREGDYPGAVRDAVAALKLNPRNDRAYATLKFSEGRVPAGASGERFGGPGAAGGPDAAAVPAPAPGAAPM
ncbi:MAG: hypothetical protein NDJ72_12345, partial [Elusimicrobia bacterium]|nr:hypothetical protein [Elusimicrobiota bacterium]